MTAKKINDLKKDMSSDDDDIVIYFLQMQHVLSGSKYQRGGEP